MKFTFLLIFSLFLIMSSCGIVKTPSSSYLSQLDKKRDYCINVNENDTTFANGVDINTIEKNGSAVIYYENGNIAFGEFKSNCADGEWKYYDKKKRLRKSELYLGCEFCVKIINYDKKGVGIVTHSLPSF